MLFIYESSFDNQDQYFHLYIGHREAIQWVIDRVGTWAKEFFSHSLKYFTFLLSESEHEMPVESSGRNIST